MKLLSHLLQRLKPYRLEFTLGTVFRVLVDVCNLFPAYGLATIINTVAQGTFDFSRVLWILGIWGALMMLRQVFMFEAKKKMHTLSTRVEMDVVREGLAHLVALDAAWHEEENAGNKIKRIQNAAVAFNQLIRIWVNNLIEVIVNFVGILIIISTIERTVALFITLYIISFYAISRAMLAKARPITQQVNVADEEANGILYENANSIRTIKLLNLSGYFAKIYHRASEAVITAYRRSVIWLQARGTMLNAWTHLWSVFIIGFIVYGISQGHYEVGFIALFYAYFGSIRESTTELSDVAETIMVSSQRIERYEQFRQIETKTESNEGKADLPKNWEQIRFANVSFSYKDYSVIKDFDLTIKRGEKVGIVGLSGAGKSTLFKLLLKEREEYTGEIMIDGRTLRSIAPASYRSRVGVVLQDTEVFNMSLRDNIILGAAVSKKDLNDILEIAHVNDFSDKLKEGLDTIIGEKGIKLSGGQRQRLGIARALIKRPEIIFFDEATSHLDLESEAKIQDSLHRAFEHITAIVIAHRLTTIKEMDRIIVIEDGTIVEEGSFAELQKKRGRFFELWEKQKVI